MGAESQQSLNRIQRLYNALNERARILHFKTRTFDGTGHSGTAYDEVTQRRDRVDQVLQKREAEAKAPES